MSTETTEARPGELAPDEVRAMFDRIAPRYDLLNRAMTMGLDRRWRRQAAAVADVAAGDRVLDVCTGTGDLALELSPRTTQLGDVLGVDVSAEMLDRAREKAERARVDNVEFGGADATALPLPDRHFDAATVAFGVRNLASLDRGLAEMARVVRPGGCVVVLEISTPPRLRPFYHLWFDRLVPALGATLGRDSAAYSYLPASVRRFPDPASLAERMHDSGLGDVHWRLLAGGIVTLHWGRVR